MKNKLFFYFNPFHANGLPTHLRKSENLHFSAVLKLEKTDFQQLTNMIYIWEMQNTLIFYEIFDLAIIENNLIL